MSQFGHSQDGGVIVLFAMMMPVLMGLSAAALDYAGLVKRRAELQRAADSASIAGVNQFKLANGDDASAVRIATAMAQAQARKSGATPQVTATVVGSHNGVQVKVSEAVSLAFGKLLNMPTVDVAVTSTAKLAGSTRLCLLALDPLAAGAFHLESAARVTATDCSLYSNSLNPAGIQGENFSVASALSTCSAGGYTGSGANFTPPPAVGCTPLRDPLADRAAPAMEPCLSLPLGLNSIIGAILKPDDKSYGANVVSTRTTLRPGTYCGGLHVTRGANVTLMPGVYVMKDGPLVVDQNATFTGTNVGFYFTGLTTGLLFDQKSTISLTAPKDGPMMGLLLQEDRTLLSSLGALTGSVLSLVPLDGKGRSKPPPGGSFVTREYRIISDNARTLLGTIYLPQGRLVIDSSKPVADMSAYTVIVARMINLYDGPNLKLNAQYGSTDIPVPKGVGPSSADTELTQ
nr:pilus assembly protein [Methylobacterium sp. OTU13CASTA1]